MAKRNFNNRDNRKDRHTTPEREGPPKVVARTYKVSSQTAYHVQRLALQEGITCGKVLDKIMRTYLATQRTHFD